MLKETNGSYNCPTKIRETLKAMGAHRSDSLKLYEGKEIKFQDKKKDQAGRDEGLFNQWFFDQKQKICINRKLRTDQEGRRAPRGSGILGKDRGLNWIKSRKKRKIGFIRKTRTRGLSWKKKRLVKKKQNKKKKKKERKKNKKKKKRKKIKKCRKQKKKKKKKKKKNKKKKRKKRGEKKKKKKRKEKKKKKKQ